MATVRTCACVCARAHARVRAGASGFVAGSGTVTLVLQRQGHEQGEIVNTGRGCSSARREEARECAWREGAHHPENFGQECVHRIVERRGRHLNENFQRLSLCDGTSSQPLDRTHALATGAPPATVEARTAAASHETLPNRENRQADSDSVSVLRVGSTRDTCSSTMGELVPEWPASGLFAF